MVNGCVVKVDEDFPLFLKDLGGPPSRPAGCPSEHAEQQEHEVERHNVLSEEQVEPEDPEGNTLLRQSVCHGGDVHDDGPMGLGCG